MDWSGQLFLWEGRGLYVGPTYRTTSHAHHAIQICVALQGRLRLRTAVKTRWRAYRAAVVPSDHQHELDAGGRSTALLYLDPEGSDAQALLRRGRTSVFSPAAPTAERLVKAALERAASGSGAESAIAFSEELIRILVPEAARLCPLDGRILRAMALLRETPELRMRLVHLSTAVALSPSRLSHLFREQVGLPIRRFLLWLRLREALAVVARGESLTTAAHAAGFSDSAHFTRTFRRMLGIAPSELAGRSKFVQA